MTPIRRGPIRPGETLESLLRRPHELSAPVLGQLLFVVMTIDPHSAVRDIVLGELRSIAAEDAAGARPNTFGVQHGCACPLCMFRRSPFSQLQDHRRCSGS